MVGSHKDDEDHIEPMSDIPSYSFGAKRDFLIRSAPKEPRQIEPHRIEMRANSLIVMCGRFQEELTHEVPVMGRARRTAGSTSQ